MDLRIGILFLFACCFTAIKSKPKPWVELDIAGNDLSQPNPQFVKPHDDCDDGQGGNQHPPEPEPEPECEKAQSHGKPHGRSAGGQRGRGHGRGGKRNPKEDPQALEEVEDFAQNNQHKRGRKGKQRNLDSDNEPNEDTPKKGKKGSRRNKDKGDDGDQTEEEECFPSSEPTVIETPQKPRLRMINSKQQKGKEKVERQTLQPTECTEIIEMEPKTSIKIETYTVPYNENVVKYKTVTRKVVYIQRRRKIKRTLNKPVLVIKRKNVKERQVFERIIPKVIETREIINKPKVEYKVIEGPMEPMNGPKPLEDEEDCDDDAPGGDPYGPGNGRNGNGLDDDCDDPAQNNHPPYAPPPANYGPGPGMDPYGQGQTPGGGYPQPYPQQYQDTSGIHVGYDFASALNTGLNAAFAHPNVDDVVAPNRRSLGQTMGQTTPCPPGMVDDGQGGGSYAQPNANAYAFQKKK